MFLISDFILCNLFILLFEGSGINRRFLTFYHNHIGYGSHQFRLLMTKTEYLKNYFSLHPPVLIKKYIILLFFVKYKKKLLLGVRRLV